MEPTLLYAVQLLPVEMRNCSRAISSGGLCAPSTAPRQFRNQERWISGKEWWNPRLSREAMAQQDDASLTANLRRWPCTPCPTSLHSLGKGGLSGQNQLLMEQLEKSTTLMGVMSTENAELAVKVAQGMSESAAKDKRIKELEVSFGPAALCKAGDKWSGLGGGGEGGAGGDEGGDDGHEGGLRGATGRAGGGPEGLQPDCHPSPHSGAMPSPANPNWPCIKVMCCPRTKAWATWAVGAVGAEAGRVLGGAGAARAGPTGRTGRGQGARSTRPPAPSSPSPATCSTCDACLRV